MRNRFRLRFVLEVGFGTAAAALGLLTVVSGDWIEAIFGVDPDQHSGSFEWLIVAGLLCTALVLGGLARAEWRRMIALPRPDPDPAGRGLIGAPSSWGGLHHEY